MKKKTGTKAIRPLRISMTRTPWLSAFLMILPALIILLVFYFYPILKLLPRSVLENGQFDFSRIAELFTDDLYRTTIFRTIGICLAATLINVLLGYPVAYMMSRAKKRTANVFLTIIMLSLWTSLLVRTYSWMVLLQRTGVINRILLALGIVTEPVQFMYTETAVLIGMVHLLLPYMILPIYSVLRSIDPNLALAAESMGASKTKAFFKVTFPLSIPGMASGVLLVFIQSLGFYVTPMLLGGSQTLMISGLIDKQMFTFLDWSFGAALGLVLLFITVIFLLIFNRFFGMDTLRKRMF